MAIIGKIRDKGWLVLVVIGLALTAFILGDWSKITQGSEPKYGYGTIYGEKVDEKKFEELVAKNQEMSDRMALQRGQQPQPVDRDAIWKSFVERELLEREYEALGIDVSENEFDAYLFGNDGFAVMDDLKQAFSDSTGNFNPKLLQSRIEEMEGSDDAEIRKSWEDSKDYYIRKRKEEKYMDILGQGVYATKLEAKEEYQATQETKSISFVVKRYREIPDEEIHVTDSKLKAYFEEHKEDKKYMIRQAARKVNFFDIMVVPSATDSMAFNKTMDSLYAQFKASKNDSAFVIKNSEMRFYSSGSMSTALPKTHPNAQQHLTYPNYMDTTFERAQVGQIVGPYIHDGAFTIAKVLGFTADTINARHILLRVEPGKEAEADKLADSLIGVLNNANFEENVQKFSTDEGSKVKGGDLGDFFFSTMTQPFAVYCAEKPIGEIGKVRSQFGIHIVQVTNRRGRMYPRLALVQKTLVPSTTTVQEKQDMAYDLLFEITEKLEKISDVDKKIEMFDTIAQRNGFLTRPINIFDNAPVLYGFTSKLAEDKILKLAFNEDAQEGDLVSSPIKDKNKHVIAILAAIQEKGQPDFADVKEMIKRDYIEEEKAKRFTAQMQGKSITNIDGATVMKAEVTFANPQIVGGGFEPEVIGAIFSAMKDGGTTKPIKGRAGVYVVRVDKTVKAPAVKDYKVEKQQLTGAVRANLAQEAKQALNKRADVVDNRRLFENQIRR